MSKGGVSVRSNPAAGEGHDPQAGEGGGAARSAGRDAFETRSKRLGKSLGKGLRRASGSPRASEGLFRGERFSLTLLGAGDKYVEVFVGGGTPATRRDLHRGRVRIGPSAYYLFDLSECLSIMTNGRNMSSCRSDQRRLTRKSLCSKVVARPADLAGGLHLH